MLFLRHAAYACGIGAFWLIRDHADLSAGHLVMTALQVVWLIPAAILQRWRGSAGPATHWAHPNGMTRTALRYGGLWLLGEQLLRLPVLLYWFVTQAIPPSPDMVDGFVGPTWGGVFEFDRMLMAALIGRPLLVTIAVVVVEWAFANGHVTWLVDRIRDRSITPDGAAGPVCRPGELTPAQRRP